MSRISTNPLDDMNNDKMTVEEKLKRADMSDAVSMGSWLLTIIDNSSEHLTKEIVNIHLELCRKAFAQMNYIPDSTSSAYQRAFNILIEQSQLLELDLGTLKVTINKQKLQTVNEVKTIQENQSRYHTENRLNTLAFNREPRQYRRVRRKITFIHDKVLVTPILEEAEKTTVPFTIRDSANSNPKKDKTILITNVVRNTLIAISDLSSTATKERNSVFLRSVYRNLLNDIENKQAKIYKFQDLVEFFEKEREVSYNKYSKVMQSIYTKVGAKVPKKIGFKNSPSIIGKDVHDYLMSENPDAVLAREYIEQYNLINIVD